MSGSHRAERPSSRKKQPAKLSGRVLAAAVVVALVPAVYFGLGKIFDGPDRPTTPAELPIPPVTTPATTTPAPATPTGPTSAGPGSTPTPTAQTPALPRVPADVPRRLVVPGVLDVGFDESVEPADGAFPTRSTAEAARWGSRGEPGSPGTDTVYLIGKVYTGSPSSFDDLLSVAPGAKIRIRTDAGTLTYTVTAAGGRPARGLLQTSEFTEKVPGRLVLVGIRYDAQDDQRAAENYVVVAQLTDAEPG